MLIKQIYMLFLFVLPRNISIYIIAFLEGGSLLSYEIMISRIYTPHLGSTIFVWTSILSTTLIALALAYRYSHRLIQNQSWKMIPLALSIAAVYILFSTYGSGFVLENTYNLSIKSASIIVGFILVFIPVYCMGLISPMLASLLSINNLELGKNTGIIYGISTLSGVLFNLLFVFYLMPIIGVKASLLLISLLLFTASGLFYFKVNNYES